MKGQLVAQWYVTALFEDIADFYIIIRDSNNQLLAERRLSYADRAVQIPADEISDEYDGQLELCVLAKTSHGDIRTWFDSQCIYLPENFEQLKRSYGPDRNRAFHIHSMRKRIRARTASTAGLSEAIKTRKSSRSNGRRPTPFIPTVISLIISICLLQVKRSLC